MKNPMYHEPWEARPSTAQGSKAWVVWGTFPENEVEATSLVTGETIQMPPERPLFVVCPSEGVDPELIARRIVAAVNAYQEVEWVE